MGAIGVNCPRCVQLCFLAAFPVTIGMRFDVVQHAYRNASIRLLHSNLAPLCLLVLLRPFGSVTQVSNLEQSERNCAQLAEVRWQSESCRSFPRVVGDHEQSCVEVSLNCRSHYSDVSADFRCTCNCVKVSLFSIACISASSAAWS
eukprot:2566952-Pleurochrysis_carterae.AAC.1